MNPVLNSPPTSRQLALEIANRIAKEHGYCLGNLQTQQKSKRLVFVRWAALAEVAVLFPLSSLPELGEWFNHHHTTILHALRRMGIAHQNAQTGRPKKPRKPGKPWAQRKARAAELKLEREQRAVAEALMQEAA